MAGAPIQNKVRYQELALNCGTSFLGVFDPFQYKPRNAHDGPIEPTLTRYVVGFCLTRIGKSRSIWASSSSVIGVGSFMASHLNGGRGPSFV